MISKAQIRYIQSLRLAKFRQKYNNFIVEGDKMVKEILSENSFVVEKLIIVEKWAKENDILVQNNQDKITYVTDKEMTKLSSLKTPPGVLLVLLKKNMDFDINKLQGKQTIYLDHISDPGNMGTIIRIADWFGFDNVVRSAGSVDFYNPKTVQASMGSISRVNLMSTDFDQLKNAQELDQLPMMYYATLEGVVLSEANFEEQQLILVIGNESKGVSTEMKRLKHQQIAISSKYCLGAESLNAAVATGIICAHIKA